MAGENRQLPAKGSPWQGGMVDGAVFTIGADAGTTVAVGIQLMIGAKECDRRVAIHGYLANDANGDTIQAAPSGGIAIGTDGLLIENIDNQSFILVSEADGDIDVVLTQTGAETMYLVLIMPNGELVVSGVITFVT